ncbi:glycosyl transferase family 2 [Spirosoma radiotolerans]|uniref:Glycosyl transferase family 2 n=1 Tax=Spirosoma radiotolerans TaxID=1379870 RepID=A0A0E4A0Q5_9BACT|nr:glycosyl transferase family 2 [Spirosoma radiotolerans]
MNGAFAQPLLFNDTPPSLQTRLTVIVPVRNEADQLTETLEALRKQLDGNSLPLNPLLYEVLLLANNCTDSSFDIARRYQQKYPAFHLHIAQVHLPPEKANIGTVRRMLMDEAYRRLTSLGRSDGIIASTDGDTVVDSHWVYNIMLEMAKGNDAVGGRILTRPDQSSVRLFHLRDVMYRTLVAKAEALFDPCLHDPWPRHFQHFGASIAVTCHMYEQVGGLPETPYLEDEAFYRALLRIDAKVRKSPHVKVYTSTRLQGRVAVGFSEQLRYWSIMNQGNQCQLAEPAGAVITRLSNRQQLRLCWQKRNQGVHTDLLKRIALELFIDSDWLIEQFKKSRFFGEIWEMIDERMTSGQWITQWKPVPITVAIRDMRNYLVR